jgi:hypothetical protein
MRCIENAEKNAFKLVFLKDKSGNIIIKKKGRIIVENNIIRLDYGFNNDKIGWPIDSCIVIGTFHRNLLPLYIRIVEDELWLSNDVAELLINNEILSIRLVEIMFAASGSEGIRSAFSHLIEDITLLLPSSLYRISFNDDSPFIIWSDINFDFQQNATKEHFLDLLIEQYKRMYYQDTNICLTLTGGYDSRLDLAILTKLKKNVYCYHYTTSKREEEKAKLVANIAGASFCALPSDELVLPGWDFLKQQGYLTRWDGFFAAGTLYSAGLYLKIMIDHPLESKLIMGFGELRGRLYEYSDNLLDYWINFEEIAINKCIKVFPEKTHKIRLEGIRRKKIIQTIIPLFQVKKIRNDIAMDITFGMFSRQGKLAARSTFLFENGTPFFNINKEVRDYFMSLPPKDKMDDVLLDWSIEQVCPELKDVVLITSTMGYAERDYGLFGRIPFVRGLLSRITKNNSAYNKEWYHDSDVIEIFKSVPDIKNIAERATGDKQRLYIAQICRFLKSVQEKKNVSFRMVD